MNLFAQLTAAAECAARLANENSGETAYMRRRSQARLQCRATSRGGSGRAITLKEVLLEQLPVGEENAVCMAKIRGLITGITYADKGLSAMLTTMHIDGLIKRIGMPKFYCYYR